MNISSAFVWCQGRKDHVSPVVSSHIHTVKHLTHGNDLKYVKRN